MEPISASQTPSRVYFRPTTLGQRQLLFRLVEETGNVSAAARQAHVGRGTYYHWLPRYQAEGAVGLANEHSRAPHRPRIPAVAAELRAEVLAYHQAHPKEGYRRIAGAIRKAHGWQKVIGHNKVKEIICQAREGETSSAVSEVAVAAPAKSVVAVAHAPCPNQTANVDLCVVPLIHDGNCSLASVSLSEAATGATDEPAPTANASWPGQAFANSALPYGEQMRLYAQQRAAKRASRGQRKHRRRQKQAERAELRTEEEVLRAQRRRVRRARQQEDAVWQAQREAHRRAKKACCAGAAQERKQHRSTWESQQADWQVIKAERKQQTAQRQAEDAAWRQARQDLSRRLAELVASAPQITAWLAILVVVDNGTRRCLGLPLFVSGVHVTAEEIIAALRPLCPPGLQFMISDNGPQFIAEVFARFSKQMGFLHVRIAPHRPCSNGIAERFVHTLKAWLSTHTWNTPEELEALVQEFVEYYNDSPHQGAGLGGLSPNEFARRCLNCSSC